MTDYLNRTKVYTLSGSLASLMSYLEPNPMAAIANWGLPSFTVMVGDLVQFQLTSFAAGGPLEPGSETLNYTLTLTWIDTRFNLMAGPPVTSTFNFSMPSLVGSHALGGSYSVTVHLDEFATPIPGATVVDPTKCQTFPNDLELDLFLLPVIGSTVTASCTYGALTVSDTATVASITPGQTFTPDGDFKMGIDPESAAVRVACTPSFGGVTAGAAAGTYTSPDTFYTFTWGGTISAAATSSAGAGGSISYVDYALVALTVYDLQGRVQAWDQLYPDDLDILLVTGTISGSGGMPRVETVTAVGGVYAKLITQQQYSVQVFNGGFRVLLNYGDLGPVYGWPSPSSLSLLGEDSDIGMQSGKEQRIWMRGWNWDAASITQAATFTAFTSTFSAVGAGGTITVPAATFDAHLRGSVWNGVSLAGYAFADLSLTVDAGTHTARVHLGGKYWDVTVNTTGTVRIDLDDPTNAAVAVDLTDTQWPWSGPSSGPLTAQSGERFGVHNTNGMTIDTLAAGRTYTLTQMDLVRTDHARLTIVAPFKKWVQAYDAATVGGVTTTTYYRRGMQGDTDAQQAMENTDLVWIHTTAGGGTDSITPVSILDRVVGFHSGTSLPRDGYDAADLQPDPADGHTLVLYNLLNSTQPSGFLLGSGAWYDGTDWHSGIDHALGTLKAQYLFNTIRGYAGAGDVWQWSGGAFGGPIKLRSCLLLRGQAWGFVADGSGRRTGITVNVKEGAADVGSTATVATVGEYESVLPFVRGGHSALITAIIGVNPSGSALFFTRKRSRCAFGPTSGGGGGLKPPDTTPGGKMPSNLERIDGRYQRTEINAAGGVTQWGSLYSVPSDTGARWSADSVVVSTNPYCLDPVLLCDCRKILYLSFAIEPATTSIPAPSDVYEAVSWDDGQTWNTPAIILPGGKFPAVACSRDNRILHAAYVDSGDDATGQIHATWQGAGDTVPSAAFALQDSTGTPIVAKKDRFGVSCAQDAQRRIWLHLNQSGSGSSSLWFSTDATGLTWTRAATGISGILFPTIACSIGGGILAAGYLDSGDGLTGTLRGIWYGPGDAAWSSPFSFLDTAGTALSVQNDRFGFSFAQDSARRIVLHLLIAGETDTSDWFCTDANGQTWTRCP